MAHDDSYFALRDSEHGTIDSPFVRSLGFPCKSIHVHPNQRLSKIITSLSNFSVQYNFQAIAIALIIMSQEVCTSTEANCKNGKQDSWVSATS